MIPTENGFGKITEYKKGDIVVWKGGYPAIGRIKGKCKIFNDCWDISKTHNSLHFCNLRLANDEEKAALGTKQMILYPKTTLP